MRALHLPLSRIRLITKPPMSYDLYFRSCKSGNEPSWEDVRSYFQGRQHYHVSNAQAFYENEITGVTFSFNEHDVEKSSSGPVDIRGERSYLELLPVTFNINYFRPHTFGLEAEPELTSFVEYFDLLVYDPQIDGMSDGIYTPGGFLKGWNSGNDFAHSALFSASPSAEIYALPAKTLEAHWRWNYRHEQLVEEYEDLGLFVPSIWYVAYRGRAYSVVSWAEGIEVALPAVDFILTHRSPSTLAKLTGGKTEQLMVKMADLLPRLDRFKRKPDPYDHFIVGFGGNTSRASSELAKLFQGKHNDWSELRRIHPERVLNAEIVEKYLAVVGR
jgi:hypothetical protein